MLDIIIPQKIENAPVVRLGYSADLYQGEEAAWPQNLFGVTMFDYCDADSRPTLEILNVKSVVMPDAILYFWCNGKLKIYSFVRQTYKFEKWNIFRKQRY